MTLEEMKAEFERDPGTLVKVNCMYCGAEVNRVAYEFDTGRTDWACSPCTRREYRKAFGHDLYQENIMVSAELYSQGAEQRYIVEAVSGVSAGRFLDIGAYHPTCFSNSRALVEAGWSGVMFEPSPEPFLSLLREYGQNEQITLVSAAVGLERGLVRLYATADATSTTDREHFHKWKGICKFYGSFFTPCVTLADIFHQFGGFDFINIDAEGISALLFFELLKTEMLPRCICVEHDNNIDVKIVAEERGYRELYRNGENAVFAR